MIFRYTLVLGAGTLKTGLENFAGDYHARTYLVVLVFPALLAVGLFSPHAPAQQTVAVDSDTVLAVAFSPDGRMLAGAGFDKGIRIWDARTGNLLRSLEGPKRTTRRSIVFSPDGQKLLGCGDDGAVHMWNAGTGALERSFAGPPGVELISSIAISPDGLKLAVANAFPPAKGRGNSSTVTLLGLKTGKQEWTWPRDNWVYSITFAPDGKTLAAADGDIHLLDSKSGKVTKSLRIEKRKTLTVAYSPDGKSLAGAGGYWEAVDGGTRQISEVYLWDPATGQLVRKLTDLGFWLRSIAFAPDGKILATGSSGPILQKGNLSWVSSEIRLWSPETGKVLRSITGELAGVNALAFSPDGKSLLSCDDEVVALTETLTGLRRLTLMKRTLKPFPKK